MPDSLSKPDEVSVDHVGIEAFELETVPNFRAV